MLFEFPPGHRLRICNFVKDIRQLKRSYNSKPNHKRSNEPELACKIPRIDPDCSESNTLSVAHIYKQIRFCVRKWISEQKDDCRNVQEGEDYTLNVASNRRSGKFDVSIRCLLCGTMMTLHQIKNSYICSNFYRHATPCVKKYNAVGGCKIKFIQSSLIFSMSNASQGKSISKVSKENSVSTGSNVNQGNSISTVPTISQGNIVSTISNFSQGNSILPVSNVSQENSISTVAPNDPNYHDLCSNSHRSLNDVSSNPTSTESSRHDPSNK